MLIELEAKLASESKVLSRAALAMGLSSGIVGSSAAGLAPRPTAQPTLQIFEITVNSPATHS